MTERWRRKLGDLDKQGPSDDVFDLAKEGPRHTDEPLHAMRPSTRIATAVAAFAVFALAISVFAIPALRMQSTDAGSASTGLFPLWPSQTPDQLKQLQADADAGNATWAFDPQLVATRFAQEVMGWSDASVEKVMEPTCVPAWGGTIGQASTPPAYASGSIVPTLVPVACPPHVVFASGVPSGNLANDPPYLGPIMASASAQGATGAPASDGGFMTFLAFPCSVRQPCIAKGFEQITVYQPLENGERQIWAVMEARSDFLTLSTAASQNVRSGASIGATAIDRAGVTTLGYASCGSSGGTSEGRSTAAGYSMTLDTSLIASSTCSGPQAGYVWAADSPSSLADGQGGVSTDPIQGGTGVLFGLTAVPVVMTFPDQEPQTVPPNGGSDGVPTTSPSASPPGDAWTTYTDPLGWTIDVPSDWQTRPITDAGNVGALFSNDEVSVQIGLVPDQTAADDSSFPLDPATLLKRMEDGVGGRFRGDGSEFMINAIPTSAPGPFPQTEEATLDHMVSSIHFEPWSTDETRGDWTAVGKVLPSASAEWITFQGGHYVAVYGSPRALLGPAPSCPGGASYEIRATGVAAITCSNGTSAEWDFTTGGSSGNTGFGSSDLQSYPAALAWNGQLLVQFGGGVQASAIPTLSPVPASSSP